MLLFLLHKKNLHRKLWRSSSDKRPGSLFIKKPKAHLIKAREAFFLLKPLKFSNKRVEGSVKEKHEGLFQRTKVEVQHIWG